MKCQNHNLSFLASTIKNLLRPALFVDSKQKIILMNEAALTLHKVDSSVLGKNYRNVCQLESLRSPLDKSNINSSNHTYVSINYGHVIIEWEIIKFKGEQTKEIFYFLLGQDISNSYQLQHQLDKISKYLSSVVNNLTGKVLTVKNTEEIIPAIKSIIRHYKSIIENLPGLIYWKDLNFVYRGANRNAVSMIGFHSLDDLIGKTDAELGEKLGWPKSVAEDFMRDDIKVMETGKPILAKEEKPFRIASGEEVVELSNRVPLYDEESNLIGVLCNTIDITELKKTQQGLLQAKDKAEEFNKLKSQFIQNMEHDIRTPASSLQGLFNYLLSKEKYQNMQTMLRLGADAADELMILLNNVVNFDKQPYDNPVLIKPFLLDDVFKSVFELYGLEAKHKNLHLSYKIDDNIAPILVGDAFRIKHILINLVGNAIKFTEKGKVFFEAKIIHKEDQNLLIDLIVKDTGIGIPKKKQTIIFEKFVRLHPSNQGQYKGSGLGLTCVRDYVEQLGGEIRPIQSQLNKGTTVSVLIPVKVSLDQNVENFKRHLEEESETEVAFFHQPSEKPIIDKVTPVSTSTPSESPTPSTSQQALKILFVEDSIFVQHMAKALLISLECEMDIAGSAEEALTFLEKNTYDLIFADIGLPKMNGIDMVRQIRKNEKQKGIHATPIVGQSANADAANRKACLEAGMQDLLPKPLSSKAVTDIFQQYIPGYGAHPIKISDLKISSPHVIDYDLLKQRMRDDNSIAEMFHDFKSVWDESISELNETYHLKNPEKLRFTIHKLRGGYIYLSAMRLDEAMAHLENYLTNNKTPDYQEIDVMYKVIIKELDSLKKEINQFPVKLS
jgi:two-component system aerobic respiration control sensor histidine kinase ArcB